LGGEALSLGVAIMDQFEMMDRYGNDFDNYDDCFNDDDFDDDSGWEDDGRYDE
jgi:hypothetical protein